MGIQMYRTPAACYKTIPNCKTEVHGFIPYILIPVCIRSHFEITIGIPEHSRPLVC